MRNLNSELFKHYAVQSDQSFQNERQFSSVCASLDPRFNKILNRTVSRREQSNGGCVNNSARIQLPGIVNIPSKAWSPETSTRKLETTNVETKKCLTPPWKNRLQGLLFGLLFTAIVTGVTVAVFLTRPSKTSTASTKTTTGCDALRWNQVGVTIAGNGTPGSALNQFNSPSGVYVDSNNIIYVADFTNHRVQKWLPDAVNGTTVAGITGTCGYGPLSSYLCYPYTIYGDSQQNIYIGDHFGIYSWPLGSSFGTMLSGSSSSTIGTTFGIFVDKYSNLYASVTLNDSVLMWTPNGTSGATIAGGHGAGYASSQLDNPRGLTVDPSTNITYVSDYNSDTVKAWQIGASNGTVILGQNSTVGAASSLLRNPSDIKRDPNGNLYVVDTGNNRILFFCQNSPSTTAITIADTSLNSPLSLALDSNLNVYVADFNNHRIRKFSRLTSLY